VARVAEAVELRELGVEKPIMVMGGGYGQDDMELAQRYGLKMGIHHRAQLDLLQRSGPRQGLDCFIKVDSGMHRLGFQPEQMAEAVTRLKQCGLLTDPPLLMTHMACADDPADPTTDLQWGRFSPLVKQYGARFSAANSAVVMSRPEMHGHWVRPGIMLYGVSPFVDSHGPDVGLRPVMTLESRLISVKRLSQGEAVGYGATWRAPHEMRLGVVAVGYGDGYPRHAPSGTPVLVNGQRLPLVGRVSMDMITVDLSQQPEAQVGDPVILWGEGLPAEEIAEAAGTIAYQLFCNVTRRVDFYTLDHG
jgi:alanine racemase